MMTTDDTSYDLGSMDGPLLLFGGPYGNLEALTAIRNEAQRRHIPAQQIICTGDLTAYCGSPFESVEVTRDWGIHVVMGNCEEALADSAMDCGCGFDEGSVCAQLSESWFGIPIAGSHQRSATGCGHFPVPCVLPSAPSRFTWCTAPPV